MADQHVPQRLIDIVGLTDDGHDPTSGVQFAVLDPDGKHYAYGDQRYVACGQAIDEAHPDGSKTQRRTITIVYGEWEDHG